GWGYLPLGACPHLRPLHGLHRRRAQESPNNSTAMSASFKAVLPKLWASVGHRLDHNKRETKAE
ncbi:MAG: hypothetical protein ACRD1G_15390, partial [Acidimicrobiales bacterium]